MTAANDNDPTDATLLALFECQDIILNMSPEEYLRYILLTFGSEVD